MLEVLWRQLHTFAGTTDKYPPSVRTQPTVWNSKAKVFVQLVSNPTKQNVSSWAIHITACIKVQNVNNVDACELIEHPTACEYLQKSDNSFG
jgi:hypothetical protein